MLAFHWLFALLVLGCAKQLGSSVGRPENDQPRPEATVDPTVAQSPAQDFDEDPKSQPLEGRVVEDRGTPIAHFELRFFPASAAPALLEDLHFSRMSESVEAMQLQRLRMDAADGRFAVAHLPSEPWCLWVSAEQHANKLLVFPALEARPLEIALDRKGTVRGSVLGPGGETTSGAYVSLARFDGEYVIRAMAQPGYVFESVDPGRLRIAVETNEWVPPLPVAIELQPGQDLDLGVWTVGIQGLIRGQIDSSLLDRPLWVTAYRPLEATLWEAGSAKVSDQGQFVLPPLEPGEYEVVLHEPFEGTGLWQSELGIRKQLTLAQGAEAWITLAPNPEWIAVTARIAKVSEPWRVAFARPGANGEEPKVLQCLSTDAKGLLHARLPPSEPLWVLARPSTPPHGLIQTIVLAKAWAPRDPEEISEWHVPTACFAVGFRTPSGAPLDAALKAEVRCFPVALGQGAAQTMVLYPTTGSIPHLLPGTEYTLIARVATAEGTEWIDLPEQRATAPAAGETLAVEWVVSAHGD